MYLCVLLCVRVCGVRLRRGRRTRYRFTLHCCHLALRAHFMLQFVCIVSQMVPSSSLKFGDFSMRLVDAVYPYVSARADATATAGRRRRPPPTSPTRQCAAPRTARSLT